MAMPSVVFGAPDNLSTDESPRTVQLVFADNSTIGNFLDVRFDNRVTLDPSLENFRRYVRTASGEYETFQGEMDFSDGDVEVLDYRAGRLKLRISATFSRMIYGTINLGGAVRVCSYSPQYAGSDPEHGELILEVEGPLDTTPPPTP